MIARDQIARDMARASQSASAPPPLVPVPGSIVNPAVSGPFVPGAGSPIASTWEIELPAVPALGRALYPNAPLAFIITFQIRVDPSAPGAPEDGPITYRIQRNGVDMMTARNVPPSPVASTNWFRSVTHTIWVNEPTDTMQDYTLHVYNGNTTDAVIRSAMLAVVGGFEWGVPPP